MNKPEVFQLIDLDRTLFNTAKFSDELTAEFNESYPGEGDRLKQLIQEARANEETFDLLSHMRYKLGSDEFDIFVKDIVKNKGHGHYKLDGFDERLQFAGELSSLNPGWGILTYGNEIDQRLKLNLVGLADAPVLVTNSAEKSLLIGEWKNKDGKFILPVEFSGSSNSSENNSDNVNGRTAVDYLTLEDDKRKAFNNLPDGVLGIWVDPNDRRVNSNLPVDPGVVAVKSLHESIRHLKKHFNV